MIEAIRLINFMAFQDTGWIDLKPITLVFGKNSSGKSALIRALLLLKQSVNTDANTADPLNFFSTTGVDLENFKTVVHTQDTRLSIGFGFRLKFSDLEGNARDKIFSYINWERDGNGESIFSPTDSNLFIEASFSYKADSQNAETLYPTSLQIDLVNLSETKRETAVLLSIYKEEKTDFIFSELPFLKTIKLRFDNPKYGFWPRYMYEGEVKETDLSLLENLSSFYEEIQKYVNTFLKEISYVGPLREPPQRVYAIDRSSREIAKGKGGNGFYRFLERQLDTADSDQIDKWVQNLELAQKIAVAPAEKNPQSIGYNSLSQVVVSERRGLVVNLAEVGSGTAQVLPVVIESIAAKDDSLVIIEQPELHLHPDAQSNIADFFIEIINKLILNGVTNKRFLIETHSEHILLRLRRRLAQTAKNVLPMEERQQELSIRQLIVYLVRRNPEKLASNISPLIFNRIGEYRHIPEGFRDFFASDTIDVLAMTDAKLTKQEGVL